MGIRPRRAAVSEASRLAGVALLLAVVVWAAAPRVSGQEEGPGPDPAVSPAGGDNAAPADGEDGEPDPGQDDLPFLVPYREEVKVRLIYVPVHVRDGDGRPVLDLTKDDFELLVDGKPMPIATFDPPLPAVAPEEPGETDEEGAQPPERHPADAPPAEGAEEDRPERLEILPWEKGEAGDEAPGAVAGEAPGMPPKASVALLLDRYLTPLRFTARSFDAARQFLAREFPPGMEVGLFVIARGDIRVVHPFTTDREALLAALAEEEEQVSQTQFWGSGGDTGSQAPGGVCAETGPLYRQRCAAVTQAGMNEKRLLLGALRGIERLGLALADRPGRRSIVFLGVGMRLRAGYGLVLQWGLCYIPCTVNNEPEFSQLAGMLKEANVTLTPIAVGGIQTQGNDSLLAGAQFFAEETGGLMPTFLNDFTGDLTQAAMAPFRSYVLGFYGPEGEPGTGHKIAVRVKRPGVTVAARNEWVEETPNFASRVGQASLLLLPPPGTSTAGGVTALLRRQGRRATLHVLLQVPWDRLTWQDAGEGRQTAHVSIAVRPETADGEAEQVFERPHIIVRGGGRGQPLSYMFEEWVESKKLRKAEQVTAVVRDQSTGLALSWSAPIVATVEEPKGPGRLSRPYLLAAAPGARLESAPERPVLSRRLGGMLFVPVLPEGGVPGPYVLGALWSGDPAADVRFCLSGEAGGCVPARLEPVEGGKRAEAKDAARVAWAITSAQSLAEADLWVEARRDGGGLPVRAALEEVPPLPEPETGAEETPAADSGEGS